MRLTFPAEGRTWQQVQRQLRNLVSLFSSSCKSIHWEQVSAVRKTSPKVSSSASGPSFPVVEGEKLLSPEMSQQAADETVPKCCQLPGF